MCLWNAQVHLLKLSQAAEQGSLILSAKDDVDLYRYTFIVTFLQISQIQSYCSRGCLWICTISTFSLKGTCCYLNKGRWTTSHVFCKISYVWKKKEIMCTRPHVTQENLLICGLLVAYNVFLMYFSYFEFQNKSVFFFHFFFFKLAFKMSETSGDKKAQLPPV